MKSSNILTTLAIGLGLFAASLAFAQGGPAHNRGAKAPADAGTACNQNCPCLVDGSCQGGPGANCSAENCPRLRDGSCENCQGCGNGTCQSPTGERKLDGTGGPGKRANQNPNCPQDGSCGGNGMGRGNGRGRG